MEVRMPRPVMLSLLLAVAEVSAVRTRYLKAAP
jgi:hypothetical protein